MPAYRVTDNLHYDGKAYAPGDPVEMPKSQADPLIEAGVLESPAKRSAIKPSPRGGTPPK